MRDLSELTSSADPAWPQVRALLDGAGSRCEVLSPLPGQREQVLERLQVSLASTLGALVWHTGMVMIDHRWLRLFGAGAGAGHCAAVHVLGGTAPTVHAEGVLMAADVLGGLFAIHGAGLDAEPGEVCYWAPDTLHWQGLGLGHSAFVASILGQGGEERWTRFYADLRWPGWQQETAALTPGQGLSLYPPPWTREGMEPAAVSRRPAALAEVIDLGFHMATQLDHPRGQP